MEDKNWEDKNRLPDTARLIDIARRAHVAYRALGERNVDRLAGRAIRSRIASKRGMMTQGDIEALAEVHVHLTRVGADPFAGHPSHFLALQLAIGTVSFCLWERLWDNRHPGRIGEAWDGEDFGLMEVWREQVRSMIKECGQGAALAMTAAQYVNKLVEAGATSEAAEELAEWMSEVTYEDEGEASRATV